MSIVYGNEADALEKSRPPYDDEDDEGYCHGCGATSKQDCECPRLGDE